MRGRFTQGEGMGKDRLEAFSDGVLAVIITIMVLEMKVGLYRHRIGSRCNLCCRCFGGFSNGFPLRFCHLVQSFRDAKSRRDASP